MASSERLVDVVEIHESADLAATDVRAAAIDGLENGNVVLLRHVGFELTAREREIIRDTDVVLPGRKERESQVGRPTLIFDPTSGEIERTRIRNPERGEIAAMMARFSEWATDLVRTLLPSYGPILARERVTFRPGIRRKLQGLHVDSSYGHPTQGRGMLRVFCNVNPDNQPRVWQIGEPFEPFVQHFLPTARARASWGSWLGEKLGFTTGRRSPYDLLMADIRRLAKGNQEFQKSAPTKMVEFPSGSCWMAITDLVTHGAHSGQHSLDQTFFLPVAGMRDPSRSSLRILERLTGQPLV